MSHNAVIRWKNGDRQFVTVALHSGLPQDEILWRCGDADGGDHVAGVEVCLRLYAYGGRGLGRFIYLEYP